ncbi:Cd(II)/Pb(II)-responsive transcriptional regulator [Microbulbifer sp. HZ11]|uniref:Cd(II)/Pb(II)-responsive transcriptional regulator n=1 Tax=Microbulbifer sp. HZ11 TaxID=1453501 RepID=UPI0005BCD7E6|nr:Cd(II)/Pb(II)-responsive transcriptional regulator [Microbulbifer sp. HZ11]
MSYRIGEAAGLAGCKVETVRYYEQMGLLPTPARSGGNFRLYSQSQVEQLSFIRHCRSLDMSLDNIRELLRFREMPGKSCAGINQLIDEHIGSIECRMNALEQLRQQLRDLRSQCSGEQSIGSCQILHGLSACGCHSAEVS